MTRQNVPPAGSFAAAAVYHRVLSFKLLSNKINVLN
jgi:hypothetical protein